MLELCGFSVSNYYNKVKLALLEKSIPFCETHAYPSGSEAFLGESPMGKVPYLKLPHGSLSESQAILEYLEQVYPLTPLYPDDAFGRAKCRELIHVIELYLELPARRLYPAAFFGGSASPELKREVQEQLGKGVRGLTRLLRLDPYVSGDRFTYADCTAVVHLPLISAACRTMFDADLLEPVPDLRRYLDMMAQRPHIQQMNADRKAGLEAFVAYRAKVQSAGKTPAVRTG
jgi:glutathione S-transferase